MISTKIFDRYCNAIDKPLYERLLAGPCAPDVSLCKRKTIMQERAMHVLAIRRPGQRGTLKRVSHYGDRLLCVRYRYDAKTGKRYKTVELIIDEAAWTPPPYTIHRDPKQRSTTLKNSPCAMKSG